jgi:GNAT superfamily N-acetyltransferase
MMVNGNAVPALAVHIDHPAVKSWSRYVGIDQNGKKFINNAVFELKKEYQGKGFGAEAFASEVAAAKAQGFAYIKTHAVGGFGEEFNGYYTWPRLGYDQSIADLAKQDDDGLGKAAAKAARKSFPSAKTVGDIMATTEGRLWWKKNGSSLEEAKFDLADGSRSMRILNDYLREKNAKKAGG